MSNVSVLVTLVPYVEFIMSNDSMLDSGVLVWAFAALIYVRVDWTNVGKLQKSMSADKIFHFFYSHVD